MLGGNDVETRPADTSSRHRREASHWSMEKLFGVPFYAGHCASWSQGQVPVRGEVVRHAEEHWPRSSSDPNKGWLGAHAPAGLSIQDITGVTKIAK